MHLQLTRDGVAYAHYLPPTGGPVQRGKAHGTLLHQDEVRAHFHRARHSRAGCDRGLAMTNVVQRTPRIRIRVRLCWTLLGLAAFASVTVLLIREAASLEVEPASVVQVITSEELNQLSVTRDGRGFAALLDVRVLDDEGKSRSIKAQTGAD